MLAIIRVKTNIEDEKLENILKKKGWIPRITNEGLIQSRKDEILDSTHQGYLELVKATLLPYVLLHDPSKTWGIVNHPSDDLITFRLENPVPERLNSAIEKLIRDLHKTNEEERDISFEFLKAEVFEPKGYIPAYSGSVLPQKRLALAIQRRQTEWYVGGVALVAAIILLLLTIPPLQEPVFAISNNDWGIWTLGLTQRLSTSAIVTATVSWLNVLLCWFDLRRQPVIDWE